MKTYLVALACAAAVISPWSAWADTAGETAPGPDVPAGTYTLDRTHASLLFRVDHMGFSRYTARFTDFDAELDFDPEQPAAASLTATVNTTSIETDFPFPEQVDFDAQLQGEEWLNTDKYPQMAYRSTGVTMTGSDTARIDGELTLRGVTRPMTLDATFNGGYPGMAMDPNARIGFSARGTLKRSAYGMTYGIPEPGSNMGVGDEVEVIIEVELSGPAWEGEGQDEA